MKKRWMVVTAVIVAVVFFTAFRRPAQQRPHTLTGDIRYHKGFHSKFLAKDRDVMVYLPPGYNRDSERRYKVLYMHDGQNLFDGATSYIPGQEWGVDETAQAMIEKGEMEPIIIVGIYNAQEQRIDEYTPTKDSKHNVGGKLDLYGRMLVEELKPFVDSQYRTLSGPQHTALAGSSLGGLATISLGLKYPETFGRLAVISPSVWWDNKTIVTKVMELKKRPDLHIWLDMGTEESKTAIDEVRLLRTALLEKGWKIGNDLSYFEDQGAKHDERAWGNRMGKIFKFLFPKI